MKKVTATYYVDGYMVCEAAMEVFTEVFGVCFNTKQLHRDGNLFWVDGDLELFVSETESYLVCVEVLEEV